MDTCQKVKINFKKKSIGFKYGIGELNWKVYVLPTQWKDPYWN